MLFTTRKEIIEFLMVYLPEYIKNESYYDKLKFLINFYECKCTDCNGNDSISECELEKKYYMMNDDQYQKFENVLMNTHL